MMSCFFFFKQKTAYDLRISDWGSDVCSSDLDVADLEAPCVERQACRVREDEQEQGPHGQGCKEQHRDDRQHHVFPARHVATYPRVIAKQQPEQEGHDRQNVVEGKRIPGRIKQGGGRVLKKKKKENKW